MIPLFLGAFSGAIMALVIEHSPSLLAYMGGHAVGGVALISSILLFCLVRS